MYRNPVYHQVVFATLMVCTFIRTIYLLRSDISKDVPPAVKEKMGKMYQTGLLTFLVGFAIWNVDNIYCSTLTEWKMTVGWPIAFLLEGTSPLFRREFPYDLFRRDRTLVVACFNRTRFLQFVGSSPSYLIVQAVGSYLMMLGTTCKSSKVSASDLERLISL